jgi:20S proteasome subunit beta 2
MSPAFCLYFSILVFTLACGEARLDSNSPSSSYYHSSSSHFEHDELKQRFLTTGTTIVGICCIDGVLLAADTRATAGPLVMDKEKLKIHAVSPRIFCCAAGTSADCDQITRKASHDLAMLRIERDMSVNGIDHKLDMLQTARLSILTSLLQTNGGRRPSAVFLLGGVDEAGPVLCQIESDGSNQAVEYAALGSGALDAISILDSEVRKLKESSTGLSVELATKIIRRAVRSGILNDLGSGSHVNICAIQKGGVKRWREDFFTNFGREQTQPKPNARSQIGQKERAQVDKAYMVESEKCVNLKSTHDLERQKVIGVSGFNIQSTGVVVDLLNFEL